MGTIFVDNIKQQSSQGSGTITIGASGETVALASGVKQSNLMYPAFEAYLSSDQALSDGATTKVQFNTEILDTDNCYDNSTNYRFTPTVAGKYYISTGLKAESSAETIQNTTIFIYKNGSVYKRNVLYAPTHQPQAFPITLDAIIDMNGSSDYIEIYIYLDVSSGSPRCDADTKASHFKAYRIGT